MNEADEERSDVRAVIEQSERHHRVLRYLPLVEEEEEDGEDAEDDEANDSCALPRIRHSSIFETKEEHDRAAGDSNDANPVDSLQACHDGRLRYLNIKA